MSVTKLTYSNSKVTVLWQPQICIHSGICFMGLPLVFDPGRRPWVDITKADAVTIIAQVKNVQAVR